MTELPESFAEGVQIIRDVRRRLFKALEESLSVDGHCKSYEGTFSIVMPNYFEQGRAQSWAVALDCYLIGPHRHYSWTGNNLASAARKADREISGWIEDHDKWFREYDDGE